ncbi:MAG: hypothetical protein ACRDHO_02195 [Actinomycetota bacterium]
MPRRALASPGNWRRVRHHGAWAARPHGAIDVETLKREQARISAEVAEAEAQLANDGEKLDQAKEIINLALDLAKNCAASYRKARSEVRKMWNRAFFREILVEDGNINRFEYEEPFASLLGSHKGQIVDERGRYLNLPPSSFHVLQRILRTEFPQRVRELLELPRPGRDRSDASGQVPSSPRRPS